MMKVGRDAIQYRFGITKQVHQGFEQWNTHNAEEAKLQMNGQDSSYAARLQGLIHLDTSCQSLNTGKPQQPKYMLYLQANS